MAAVEQKPRMDAGAASMAAAEQKPRMDAGAASMAAAEQKPPIFVGGAYSLSGSELTDPRMVVLIVAVAYIHTYVRTHTSMCSCVLPSRSRPDLA